MAFHIENSHLLCSVSQITGFYTECNTGLKWINPTTALGAGEFDPIRGLSKNVFSKERVKSWFFATFNNMIRYIFPENFIEIPQVV